LRPIKPTKTKAPKQSRSDAPTPVNACSLNPIDSLQERVESDPYAMLSDCLTAIRGVNKTDVLTLSSTFGSFKNIAECSMEELSLCPGLGARKVKNLHETFHAPFDPTKKKKQKMEAQIESFLTRKVRTKKQMKSSTAKSEQELSEKENRKEN